LIVLGNLLNWKLWNLWNLFAIFTFETNFSYLHGVEDKRGKWKPKSSEAEPWLEAIATETELFEVVASFRGQKFCRLFCFRNIYNFLKLIFDHRFFQPILATQSNTKTKKLECCFVTCWSFDFLLLTLFLN
jgi:hypothetical protein